MILGAPKSRAGLRTVNIPAAVLPELAAHMAGYTQPGPNAPVFTGVSGGPPRRSGFNMLSGWPRVVTGMTLPGLHIYDFRHAGTGGCGTAAAGGQLLAVIPAYAVARPSWLAVGESDPRVMPRSMRAEK